MPLLKINGMTLKVLPDIQKNGAVMNESMRRILSPEALAEHQKWLLDFFGPSRTVYQMRDGEIEIDAANKVIIGNPRTIMKWHKRELRDGLSHQYQERTVIHDLWLSKRQFPYFDEIWGYSDEVQKPKSKCSCGRCHITSPSAQIKRTKKAQEPEIRAYELAA